MQTRACCAAMDYNMNCDRAQVTLPNYHYALDMSNMKLQAKTAKGVPRFDLVKTRHGKKYFAKVVKEPKDQSWMKVAVDLAIQCVETGTKPSVSAPTLDAVPSVRPVVAKPNKSEAIQFHQSRMNKNM